MISAVISEQLRKWADDALFAGSGLFYVVDKEDESTAWKILRQDGQVESWPQNWIEFFSEPLDETR